MSKKLKITLVKGQAGKSQHQRKVVAGLGLRKINQTVVLEDTPAIRGMVRKIDFMLRVEQA